MRTFLFAKDEDVVGPVLFLGLFPNLKAGELTELLIFVVRLEEFSIPSGKSC